MFKILGIGTYLAVSLGVRAVTGFMGAYRCPRFSKGFKKMGTKEEHMENGPERSLGPERFQIPQPTPEQVQYVAELLQWQNRSNAPTRLSDRSREPRMD